uniref:Uncharacterized protein n=1 Tax=Anguilla anguilla TaxID=7936 RepID=A0A0E9VN18_ANGAN
MYPVVIGTANLEMAVYLYGRRSPVVYLARPFAIH